MKKMLMTLAMMAAMGAVTGCKSFGPTPEQSAASLAAYQAFVGQQRSYDSIRVVGTPENPATFTMTGAEITVSSALPALSALGNDETRARIAEAGFNAIRTIAGIAGAVAGMNIIAGQSQNGQVNYAAPVAP